MYPPTVIIHGLYILNPLFEGQMFIYKGFFLMLALCMVSVQEQFILAG